MKTPVTICDSCPCMNNDNEYGSSCNLGYDCDLRQFDIGIVVPSASNVFKHCSFDCRLEYVKDNGKEIRPDKTELEIKEPKTVFITSSLKDYLNKDE